jgi:hypothetical protein
MVKVTVNVTQLLTHENTISSTSNRVSMIVKIVGGIVIVTGTLPPGVETDTGPTKNVPGVPVMFTVTPDLMLTLVARVVMVMVLLQRLAMVNCASAPEAHVPANTTTTTSTAACRELPDFPELIAMMLAS